MKQIFPKPILFSILIFTLFSCKKQSNTTDSNSLILSNWTGVNKITKVTTKNPSTNVESYFYDTLFEINSGSNFYLQFKVDSLTSNGHYVYPSSSVNNVSIGNIRYNIKNQMLTFPLNPYTLEGVLNNTGKYSSKILELTGTKLVLYDIDTLQPNPLVINQCWWNFRK